MNKAQIAKWLVGAGVSASVALSGGYLIAPNEGEVVDKVTGKHIAYLDDVGVATACWGQTGTDLYGRQIKLGMSYTEGECIEMLTKTLASFDRRLKQLVSVPYASEYQHAALLSFSYNVGLGNFESSTLRRKLNAGDHEGACDELSKWVYAKKKKLKGLVTRREQERQWCLGNVPQDIVVTFNDIVKMTAEISKKEE